MDNVKRRAKRVFIGATGGIVLLAGIIAIPYPGPGWLTVFAGLAILATEFEWAQRVLDKVRAQYDRGQAWLKRQNIFVRLLAAALTGLVVVVTIWLLNGFGILADLFNLDIPWVRSPIFG